MVPSVYSSSIIRNSTLRNWGSW